MYIWRLTILGDSTAAFIKAAKDARAKYSLEANAPKIIEAFRAAVK